MPRAGLLLLTLLLCFGPETVRIINPAALREIVDHVLPGNKLWDMQAAINEEGGLHDTDEGHIVAARMKHLGRAGEHAERHLLQGNQNSPVQKLLAWTYNERSCLIFFTIHSPCAGMC
ncbi:unnamed protein product [Caretta caretta]